MTTAQPARRIAPVRTAATARLAASPAKVALRLKWHHQFQFAGCYAAQLQGHYRREGLDATLLPAVLAAGLLVFLWITQLRRTVDARTRALRESEARYRSILNASPDDITIADLEGRILMVSPMAATLWREPEGDLMGRPVLEFVVPEERERAQEHFARMVRGDGPGPGEYHGLRRDGGVFEVEANGEAIRDAQGRPASVVLVVRDITERRRLEQERRQLQARLNQAQKLESLGSLAGGVAHDMNNVLAAILGMVSLHREQAPPGSPLAQGLETITRAAERGGKMVKSLLRLARQNPAEERELDLNAKEVGKSTGLGLSMVYSTVKAHRGQLDIQSEPGKGTLVTLAFPACTAGAQVQAAGTPDRPGPEAEPLAVLLVDDDDLVQDSVRAILEVLGHTVVLASSGEEALTKVEAFRPDVVILDVNMPGLGGSGTLPRLRALLPDVPVLLVTGRADQATHDLAARHSGVTLLAKPFGLRDLQQYLDACGRRDPA